MSAKGIEPLTNGLKGHCSAIELRARSEVHSTTLNIMRQPIRISSSKMLLKYNRQVKRKCTEVYGVRNRSDEYKGPLSNHLHKPYPVSCIAGDIAKMI